VISRKSLLAGKWLEGYQTCTRLFPAGPASRVCSTSRSMSKITLYWHFVEGCVEGQGRGQRLRDRGTYMISQKSLLLPGKWLHRDQTRSFPITSPTFCTFGFLPHSNPQMAVSLRCEFRHSSRGETVCQTVCYTVRSHVLSLHALTL